MYCKQIYKPLLFLFLLIGMVSFTTISSDTTGNITELSPEMIGYRMIDVNGQIHRVGTENGSSKPITLIFIDVECPISQRYIPTLNELAKEANEKGVLFYGVISDPVTTCEQAKAFSDEFAIEFTVLFDASGDVARKLRPTTLPQSYVINTKDEIIYYGRINDEYVAPGKVRKQITSHDLKDAISAASRGELPISTFEEPIGCIFESWKTDYPETVTYNRHIAPILNANCVNCHRDGEIAPFSLLGYDKSKRRAEMIEYVTRTRYMPIWKPSKGKGDFRDEHFLNDYQIGLLKKWSETDSPEGKTEEKIPEPIFTQVDWQNGTPDRIIKMTDEYTVPSKGEDIYRYFVVPEAFTENQIIKALDFKPGAKEVVHHVIFLLDYSGKAKELDKKDPEPGFSVFDQNGFMLNPGVFAFGGWNPGTEPYILGEDVGMFIPAGADVVMEIHYHLTGKEVKDQSSIALYYAKKEPKKYIAGMIMGTKDIAIPAGEKDYSKQIWMEAPADFHLTDITPHMHYIGQSANVTLTRPDGSEETLIQIDDWDLRWQNIYVYREPLFVPKGSRIEANYTFNNTKENPDNPNNPVKDINWGWGANDEMCELFMTFIPVDHKTTGLIKRAALASWIHIDSLSEGHLISTKGVDETANELLTVDIWSEKGQALLVSVYESDHVKEILKYFKEGEAKNDRNQTFLTNFGVYLTLYIATKETTSGVFWDAFKANALFKNAIQLNRKDWNANYSKAYSYVETQRKGYVKKGLRALKKLIKRYPNNEMDKYHHAYLSLSKAYKFIGNDKKAKEVMEKAILLFPKNKRIIQEHTIYKFN